MSRLHRNALLPEGDEEPNTTEDNLDEVFEDYENLCRHHLSNYRENSALGTEEVLSLMLVDAVRYLALNISRIVGMTEQDFGERQDSRERWKNLVDDLTKPHQGFGFDFLSKKPDDDEEGEN